LVENFVAQTLCSLKIKPYYWHSEGKAEVDFVIDVQNQIIPIEAKAGVNVKSRSLGVFAEKYQPQLMVRASLMPYQKKDHMLNVPLYALSKELLGFKS
jgi:uncharacterized protein